MDEYDVVVVGIGTAGETAAGMLQAGGNKVALIDQGPVGGTCALRGCQPKKVFVVNTHLAAESRALVGQGLSQPAVTDWGALQRFKRTFTDPIPASTQASLEASGIDVFVEPAAFVEPGVIELADSSRKLRAAKFLIASGARSRALPVPGAELAATSDDFLELDELPESMVFIGGGYISLEFAFLAALSGSKVTILQRGPRMLPQFPASLVDPVVEAGTKHGIQFVTDADVAGIERDGSGYRVATQGQGEFAAAWVMGAIGRSPNVENLGLEKAGVKASGRGIEVNEYLETSAPGVYAAGDCVATKQLSPISDMEARAAAANIMNERSVAADYNLVPSVVFTHPQMASVGLTPEGAREEGREVTVKSGRGDAWASYRRLGDPVVVYETVADAKTGVLLGAHIVSP
ncbi:MAG TPA: NAD(P)/FAD-dependent oxidoreductase, partial [Spirochaetia bacterium]|nr:NAD(P)/FAD-dependent oxidoreductase [Spirochaetia bacterium]